MKYNNRQISNSMAYRKAIAEKDNQLKLKSLFQVSARLRSEMRLRLSSWIVPQGKFKAANSLLANLIPYA